MTTTQAPEQTSQLMLDHPGWFISADGYAQRAFQSGGTVWMITCKRVTTSFDPVVEIVHQGTTPADACPVVDRFDSTTLPPTIRRVLLDDSSGHLHRVRGLDLWDAMLIPILQHRRKNVDAADMYRSFCALYGTTVTTELGTALLPPRPETALTLDDNMAMMGRRMPAVRTAAHEYLRLHLDSALLPPAELFQSLVKIPGIGKWSAARVVADTTGDFNFYQHAGFGSPKYWQQTAESSEDAEAQTCPFYWNFFSYGQKSALIALSIHRDLSNPSKIEAISTGRRLHGLVHSRYSEAPTCRY